MGTAESLVNLSSAPELAGRIAEFATILEKHGWLAKARAGKMPPMHVMVKAINAAHDVTVDFRRMGKWGRYINYYTAFYNANLQGASKTLRTFRDNPSGTMARITFQRMPLAVAYWLYKHDDDDYEERPEWQDGFYVFRRGDGKGTWTIPRPYEWALTDSAAERMMDAMFDKAPDQFMRWAKQVAGTINPLKTPSGLTPVTETFFNWSLFGSRPVVSRSLQRLEPVDQHYRHTTDIAKVIASMMAIVSDGAVVMAPAKIDHLANGLTGGLYGDVTSFTKKVVQTVAGIDETGISLAETPFLKGIVKGKEYHKSIDDFYTEKDRIEKKYNSAKKHGTMTLELSDSNSFLTSAGGLIGKMRSEEEGLERKERAAVERSIAAITRQALGREELDTYPNPLKTLEGLPSGVQKVVRDHLGSKGSSVSQGEKFGTTQTKAARYLKELDAGHDIVYNATYDRLRSGGRSPKSAKNQVERLKRRPF